MGENNSKPKIKKGIDIDKQDNTIKPCFVLLSSKTITTINLAEDIERNYIKESILYQNYQTQRIIYKLKHRLTKEPKLMDQISLNDSSINYENQVNLLIGLDHPNILKIFGTYQTKDTFNVIKDYSTGHTLHNIINEKGPFLEKAASYIIYQLLLALHYLNQLHIYPTNIYNKSIYAEKKSNVHYTIKIHTIDHTITFPDINTNKPISSLYDCQPPEYYGKEPITDKFNSWHIGIILYELLTRTKPYTFTKSDFKNKTFNKKIDMLIPEITETSKECQELLSKLLKDKPSKRINIIQALKSKWFTIFETEKMLNYISDETVVIDLANNLKHYHRRSVLQESAVRYLIHNMAGNPDIINAEKLFRVFDKQHTGTLSKEELVHAINTVYDKVSFTANDATVLFDQLDTNHNGTIELKEFICAAIDRRIFLEDEVIRFCFDYFDIDNNGRITIDEIEKLFEDVIDNNTITKTDSIRSIMNEVDLNKSGDISYEEFKIAMQTLLYE